MAASGMESDLVVSSAALSKGLHSNDVLSNRIGLSNNGLECSGILINSSI